VDADAHPHGLGRELALDLDGGLHRVERAREHAHRAVAEPLDDRPAVRVVMPIDRGRVTVAALDRGTFVRLHQRRVAHHVGEHHCQKPALEPHVPTLTRF
jgi:hypothetical protein